MATGFIRSISAQNITRRRRSAAFVQNILDLRCHLTTSTNAFYNEEPSMYVTGVSSQELEKNSEIAAFYAANFVEEDYLKFSRESRKAKKVAEQDSEVTDDDNLSAKLNIRSLECEIRDSVTEEGSRGCRKLRQRSLMIPGVLYGTGIGTNERIFVKTQLKNIQREMDLYRHSFQSRVYELAVLGTDMEPTLAVPSDLQMHPIKNKPYCVNYLRYYPGREIEIPVLYVNEEESATLKRGGFIVPLKRKIPVTIEQGVPIPDFIRLECAGLKRKEVLKVDRLIIPEGVKMCKHVNPKTFLIGSVFGKASAETETDTPEIE